MKRAGLILALLLGTLGLILFSKHIEAEKTTGDTGNPRGFDYYAWGSILYDDMNRPQVLGTADIYFTGNRAKVTAQDYELVKKFYLLAGLGEAEADSAAAKDTQQRMALYEEAVSRGYTVTEQEIQEKLAELKEDVETASNQDTILEMIAAFPSEAAFWDYQKYLLHVSLPIMKLNHALEADYFRSHEAEGQDFDIQEEYIAYFEQFKADLVAKENFQQVK